MNGNSHADDHPPRPAVPRRQFAIAIIGAGLTFALALLLTGVSAGFDTEAEDTIDAIAADGWVVEKGVSGPFTSVSAMPVATAEKLRRQEGVKEAEPFVALSQTMRRDGELVIINVNGVQPGRLGAPEPDDGRALRKPGEAVVRQGDGRRDRPQVHDRRGEVRGRRGARRPHLPRRPAGRLPDDRRRAAAGVRAVGRSRTRSCSPATLDEPAQRPCRAEQRRRRGGHAAAAGGRDPGDRHPAPADVDRRGGDHRRGDLPLGAGAADRLRGAEGGRRRVALARARALAAGDRRLADRRRARRRLRDRPAAGVPAADHDQLRRLHADGRVAVLVGVIWRAWRRCGGCSGSTPALAFG